MAKLEIVSKKENPLFKREEIIFKVKDSGATPSRREVRELLLASTKSKEDLLVVKKIETSFGDNIASGLAYIYKDKENMERIEQKYIIKRNQPKEEKKVEKPAEPAPAEPAADSKEEAPVEEQSPEPAESESKEETAESDSSEKKEEEKDE